MKDDASALGERRTITRLELCNAVHRRVGLSRAESAELVELVLQEICDALASGENVKLSSFGTFLLRNKGLRVGRNPKSGVVAPVSPRRVVVFKPSFKIKALINARLSSDKD